MSKSGHVLDVSTISLAGADAILRAARQEAGRRGVAVSVAVLDRGGFLVGFLRMDGIHAGTVAVSMGKARTAILFNRPTGALGAAVAAGNTSLLSLPDMIPLPGGVPIQGVIGPAGAVGVSGATPEVDEAIALAGSAAFEGVGPS